MFFVIIGGYFFPEPFLLDSLRILNSLPMPPSILTSFAPSVAGACVKGSFLEGLLILACCQLPSVSDGLLGS